MDLSTSRSSSSLDDGHISPWIYMTLILWQLQDESRSMAFVILEKSRMLPTMVSQTFCFGTYLVLSFARMI
jgi:hypothetical protein